MLRCVSSSPAGVPKQPEPAHQALTQPTSPALSDPRMERPGSPTRTGGGAVTRADYSRWACSEQKRIDATEAARQREYRSQLKEERARKWAQHEPKGPCVHNLAFLATAQTATVLGRGYDAWTVRLGPSGFRHHW